MEQYQRAIQDFDKAISLNPSLAKAYSYRSNAYLGLGQHDRAIVDIKNVALLAPNVPEVFFILGNIYFMLGDYVLAIKNYDKAISLKSDYAHAYHNRGVTKKKIVDIEGAAADFAKAEELGLILSEDQLTRG